ncbi:phosphatase PAP2 family protein [Psittacicella hinzii]|uniref:undecaprenyl-diphosphate phosphatase n=1 Tax=Psittacicella hinzii TaxID=2028575 RepID=A0A3A1YNE0_9GAMM|nr:phosphatase PAP2 family protein [Psittacicella hinzii]RIY39195.1 hypothetical protein CKF58_02695 [Psittacicella hinzii]
MKFSYFYIPFVILLAVPCVFIFMGYAWDLNQLASHSSFWSYITATANTKSAMVLSAIFLLVLLSFYYRNLPLSIAITVYCAFAVAGTQLIKEGLKATFQEPRPFVYQIAYRLTDIGDKHFVANFDQQYKAELAAKGVQVTTEETPEAAAANESAQSTTQGIINYYYDLSKEGKEAFIKYFESTYMVGDGESARRNALNHLVAESPYSFPSGHSIFAATWVMIFFVMAYAAKKLTFWLVAFGVLGWGICVEVSRIILGYHYAHDVLASNMIAGVFVFATFWLMRVVYKIALKRMAPEQAAESAAKAE